MRPQEKNNELGMAGKQSQIVHLTFQQKVDVSIMKKSQITTALLISSTILVVAGRDIRIYKLRKMIIRRPK